MVDEFCSKELNGKNYDIKKLFCDYLYSDPNIMSDIIEVLSDSLKEKVGPIRVFDFQDKVYLLRYVIDLNYMMSDYQKEQLVSQTINESLLQVFNKNKDIIVSTINTCMGNIEADRFDYMLNSNATHSIENLYTSTMFNLDENKALSLTVRLY